MARIVKIPRDVAGVVLPNGVTYSGPVQVTLSDGEFGQIPQSYFTKRRVIDLGPPSSGFQILSDKGAPSGYAPLDGNGNVPIDHLDGMAEVEVAGTTLGKTTMVDGAPVVSFRTNWGINEFGPYYDPAGVIGPQAAILIVADDGQLSVVGPY